MFINTTPHAISIKLNDGTIHVVSPTADKAVHDLFRCVATSTRLPDMPYKDTSITMTGPTTYTLDEKVCSEFFANNTFTEDTYYLVSTIAAGAWQDCSLEAPDKFHVVVPYSGPKPELCYRENGNIVWVAMLIDYTDKVLVFEQ